MLSITEGLEKFNQLTDALRQAIDCYLDPYATVFPDVCHRRALRELVPGLLAARSPHLIKAAAHAPADASREWARTKRFYTLMHTDRFSHRDWLVGQQRWLASAYPQMLPKGAGCPKSL